MVQLNILALVVRISFIRMRQRRSRHYYVLDCGVSTDALFSVYAAVKLCPQSEALWAENRSYGSMSPFALDQRNRVFQEAEFLLASAAAIYSTGWWCAKPCA